MDWEIHDKWAHKLGISKDVSEYVNNVIDVPKDSITLPQEYLDFVSKEAKEIGEQSKRSGGAIEDLIKTGTLRHDAARQEGRIGIEAAKIQLKFLKNKGKDFERAWYLHHTLDYLEWGKKELQKNVPSVTIKELFRIYQKNKPITFSAEIVDFLKEIVQELEKDLNL